MAQLTIHIFNNNIEYLRLKSKAYLDSFCFLRSIIFTIIILMGGSFAQDFAQEKIKTLDCAKVDLSLVFDFSGSMSTDYQKNVMQSALGAFTHYELSEDTLGVGIIVFTHKAKELQPITYNRETLEAAMNKRRFLHKYGTLLAPPLEFVKTQHLDNLTKNPKRQDAHKIAILFTDGDEHPPSMSSYTKEKISQETKAAKNETLALADELRNGDWNNKGSNNNFEIFAVAIPEQKTIYRHEPTDQYELDYPLQLGWPRQEHKKIPADTVYQDRRIPIGVTLDDSNIDYQHLYSIVSAPENLIVIEYEKLFDALDALNICG